jgi:hypothetical protein
MSASETSAKPKVLVIHALRPTSRQTTIDHLLSFKEHLPHADVQYLHFQQPLPTEIGEVSPDLLIVNYDYLNYRFSPLWPYIKRRHKEIADRSGKVVAIVQDDFWANRLLDDWCMHWDVDRILTPIDNDRDVLYPKSIKHKEFCTGLTGYVKSAAVPPTPLLSERPIDLGQRVREMPPHLGRIAQSKARQAVVMADAARKDGFVVDVSTRVEDSFIGKAWFDFLASCKFTVGMKGGASLNDPYGLIHTKVQSYLARHPNASFDEIERRCFRGKDMKHQFTAISPRLFESAMAGTCQILERNEYLGILEPWRDYIPLESDYSNINAVLDAMKDLAQCQEIVSNARRVLVESELFDYSHLVKTTTDSLLSARSERNEEWQSLCGYLDRSAYVFDDYGSELHDAVFHLINEDAIEELTDLFDSTLNVAQQEVLKYFEPKSDRIWLTDMIQTYCKDAVAVRSAWIWRPVPKNT